MGYSRGGGKTGTGAQVPGGGQQPFGGVLGRRGPGGGRQRRVVLRKGLGSSGICSGLDLDVGLSFGCQVRFWVRSGHWARLCAGFGTRGPALCWISDVGICFGSGPDWKICFGLDLGREDLLHVGSQLLGSVLGQVWTLGSALSQIWGTGICSTSNSGHWDLFCVGFGVLRPGMCQTRVGTGAGPRSSSPKHRRAAPRGSAAVCLSVHHNSAWYRSALKTSLGCMKMPSITFQ